MNRALNTDEVAEPNSFAIDAAVAAFNESGEWLDSLRAYIEENKRFVQDFFRKEIPEFKIVPGEATYLLWIDVSALTDDGDALALHIRKSGKVRLSAGSAYGECGKSFLRMNVACPRSLLEDALKRIKGAGLSNKFVV